jgi:hypothetical protein
MFSLPGIISRRAYTNVVQSIAEKKPVLAYKFDAKPPTNFGTNTLAYDMPNSTVSSTIVTGVSNSLDITGSSSLVNTSLTLLPNTATVEMWFRPSQTTNLNCLLFFGTNSGSNFNFRILHNTAIGLDQQIGATGTYVGHVLTNCISANTTYHLVITKNGTTYTLYLNGTARTWTTSATFSAFSTSTPQIHIGRSFDSRNFQGRLGLLAIYHDRILSPSIIQSHYALGTA